MWCYHPISYDLNYVIFSHMLQLICFCFLPSAGEESSLSSSMHSPPFWCNSCSPASETADNVFDLQLNACNLLEKNYSLTIVKDNSWINLYRNILFMNWGLQAYHLSTIHTAVTKIYKRGVDYWSKFYGNQKGIKRLCNKKRFLGSSIKNLNYGTKTRKTVWLGTWESSELDPGCFPAFFWYVHFFVRSIAVSITLIFSPFLGGSWDQPPAQRPRTMTPDTVQWPVHS